MLFRRYSRFVPNLTCQDGSDFKALMGLVERDLGARLEEAL
jgi:hypothetical protein